MKAETAISKACVDALTAAGALAIRINSGKVQVRRGWLYLAPKGTPDIWVIVPPYGQLLCLEVKTATTKETPEQLAWAAAARRLGVAVRTVRTPAEAVQAYLDAKASPRAA